MTKILSDMGLATLLTFVTSVIIFLIERLGLVAMYALSPLPFLTFGETLLLLLFSVWFAWWVFILVGFELLRKAFMPSP